MSERPWPNWERWDRLWFDDDPDGPDIILLLEPDPLDVEPEIDTRWDREREDRQNRT